MRSSCWSLRISARTWTRIFASRLDSGSSPNREAGGRTRHPPRPPPAAEANPAGIGLREAGQQPEQRGLPAPRGTEQREQLAVGHDEIGMVDGGDGAEALAEPGEGDLHGLRWGAALPLPSSSARPPL